ncbi:MAG: hypothetical protein ACREVS_20750 [Burkholderiales bacterium]
MALTWALWLGPAVALAQTTGARPDPTDPRLNAPPPATESAFAGYRGYRDEPLADWRAVNDEMRALGGHAGHIRDAAPADRALPAGDRATPKPAAASPGEKHAH